MKIIGLLEVKTKLSEVCEEVAVSHEPVIVTRRGKPLVRILPIDADRTTISERRSSYLATHARQETEDDLDFEVSSSHEDDDLVAEASRLTGIKTKRWLVQEALKLLIDTKRRESLLHLEGKIRFAEDYDYKRLRKGTA